MSSDGELEKEFEDDSFVAGTPRHRLMEARVLDDKFAQTTLDSDQQFFIEEILRSPDKSVCIVLYVGVLTNVAVGSSR